MCDAALPRLTLPRRHHLLRELLGIFVQLLGSRAPFGFLQLFVGRSPHVLHKWCVSMWLASTAVPGSMATTLLRLVSVFRCMFSGWRGGGSVFVLHVTVLLTCCDH